MLETVGQPGFNVYLQGFKTGLAQDRRLSAIVENRIVMALGSIQALKESLRQTLVDAALEGKSLEALDALAQKIVDSLALLNTESQRHKINLELQQIFAEGAAVMAPKTFVAEFKQILAQMNEERQTLNTIASKFIAVRTDLDAKWTAATKEFSNTVGPLVVLGPLGAGSGLMGIVGVTQGEMIDKVMGAGCLGFAALLLFCTAAAILGPVFSFFSADLPQPPEALPKIGLFD